MYCHIHHCHYHHCNCVPKDNKENGKALTQEELLALTEEMKEELKDYTVDLKDQIFSYIDIGVNPVEIANTFASLKGQDTYILSTLTNKIDELNNTTNLSMFNLRTRVTDLEGQSATIIQDLATSNVELNKVKLDTGITATPKYTGAVSRTQAAKNSDSMSIEDFKSVNDIDYTQAFLRARDALEENGGGVLNLVPGKEYLLSDKVVFHTSGITIAGNQSTIRYGSQIAVDPATVLQIGVFEFIGSYDSTPITSIKGNVPFDSLDIPVNSVVGISKGDYVYIYANQGNSKPIRFIRHIFRVTYVDAANGYIGIDNPFCTEIIDASHSVDIYKAQPIRDCHVTGLHFEFFNQTERNKSIGGVQFHYAVNCSATKITGTRFWFKLLSWHWSSACLVDTLTTWDCAGDDGGEGYANQFEFSNACIIQNTWSYDTNSSNDFTASVNCTAMNMWDFFNRSSSFSLHSMCEHNITFINCHSFKSPTYGFALGTTDQISALGRWTSNVTLINCSVIDSREGAAKAGTVLGTYKFINCDFRTKDIGPPNSAYSFSLTVSNADVTIDGCNLPNGLYIQDNGIVKNDGFVKMSNSKVRSNKGSTFAIQMGDKCRLEISDSDIENQWKLLGKAYIRINNCDIQCLGEHFTTVNPPLAEIDISNSKVWLQTGTTGQRYILNAEVLNLHNNVFNASLDKGLEITASRLSATNNRGSMKLRATTSNQLTYKDNDLVNLIGTDFLLLTASTGVADIKNNNLKGLVGNTLVSINAGNVFNVLNYVGNTVNADSVITATPNKGFIMQNTVDGVATYPTATSSRIVKDNI